MRGRVAHQTNLFVKINLEDLVPADHPLRPIKAMADEALAGMSRTFAALYAPASEGGRSSVPPERLIKALVLLTLYTVRSERALCERITFDMLFRWFLDMTPDEDCFDHSNFTYFRTRIKGLDVTKKFSDAIVKQATIEALTRLQLKHARPDDHTKEHLETIAMEGDSPRWREWARTELARQK